MKSPEKVTERQDEERRLERERQNEALESRVAREEQQRVRADFIVRALKEMAYSSEPAEDIKINKDYFKMLAGHLVKNSPEKAMALLEGYASHLKREKGFFRTYFGRNSDIAEVYNDIGVIAHENNLLGEAKKHYENALFFDSGLVDAQFNLGMLYADTGNIKDAVESFRKYLGLKAGDARLGELQKRIVKTASEKHWRDGNLRGVLVENLA